MTLQELKAELEKENLGIIDSDGEAFLLDKSIAFSDKVKYFTPKDTMPSIDNYIKVTQLLTIYFNTNQ